MRTLSAHHEPDGLFAPHRLASRLMTAASSTCLDVTPEPCFSILLPSRNRLELLRHALASVHVQDFTDFEVIVADNASDQIYETQFSTPGDAKVRFLRSEQPLSVTQNWNRALEAAKGRYVIMLGDDDALTPGLLRRLADLIQRFEQPDVIYLMAYHYAYPGVFEGQPEGYFCIVNNSPIFDMAPVPFLLDPERARKLGRLALRFKHKISFNAQHFVWRRAHVRELGLRPFYRSPYPDYFAAFVAFLTARRIVVVPSPEIIIGISKRSFGFYLAKNREAEGFQQFLGEDLDEQELANGDERVGYALRHPGSEHLRNWLLAAIFAKRALHDACDLAIDLRRYCRLQAFELAHRAGYLKTLDRKKFWKDCENLDDAEKAHIKRMLWLFRTIDRVAGLPRASASQGLYNLIDVYHTPKIYMLDIGAHQTIMDAVRWLEPPPGRADESAVSKRQKEIMVSLADSASKSADMSGLIDLITGLRQSLAERERLATEERAEAARLGEVIRQAEAGGEILRITIAKQADEIDELRSQLQQQSQHFATLQSEYQASAMSRAELQDRIAQIASSTSWRVTWPLRACDRVLRWLRRRIANRAIPPTANLGWRLGVQEKRSNVYDGPAESVSRAAQLPVQLSRVEPEEAEISALEALVRDSGLFDGDWYLERYPDVKAHGLDPLRHFVSSGLQENRDPNPLFDSSWYLRIYPDVAAAGVQPLLHYIDYGSAEGRQPSAGFDGKWYREQYPDVAESGELPLAHYLRVGQRSQRLPRDPNREYRLEVIVEPEEAEISALEALIRDSGLFDGDWYLERYPDVKAHGLNPLRHFVSSGLQENRDPNPLFDSSWYLRIYPDVAAAGAQPLLHYIDSGSAEGRHPSAGFDGKWYREQYPDVAESWELPLAHYLRVGQRSQRLPRDPNSEYRLEVLNESQQFAFEAPELRRHISVMLIVPRFFIYIEGEDQASRQKTIDSLKRQIYSEYVIVEELGASLFEDLASEDACGFFLWTRAGDVISQHALYEFASVINADPSAELVYADQDLISPEGVRSKPFYKPDWSPDYLESFNYIGSAACFRGSTAASLLRSSSCVYDFVLRFVERGERTVHIRKVLLHAKEDVLQPTSQANLDREIRALQARLERTGRTGWIEPIIPGLGCYDIKLNLKTEPLISVVIPTAGKTALIDGRNIDLITNCLDSIVRRSTYKSLEFIVVDNGDLGELRTNELRRRGCKLTTYSGSKFNIAAKLNLGASIATGEMLLLLNDDIEPINSDWIERMLEHFEKPHVGVVGAKLLYPDFRTQHVGVVLNSGNPDHVRRLQPRGDLGYFFSTCAVHNFTAVTGAAMMTQTSIYRDVGGYAVELATSYNDTDYCLKLIERGLTVVYAPSAELIHFESQSREARLDPAEIEYFARRWAPMVTSDRFYNESKLTVASPTFETRQNERQI
jgi:O-antigen biosynthesis protein